MTECCALRAKTYAYKLDDDTEMKKAKGTKKCIVKREIIFKNYVDASFNDEVIIRSQQRFRSDHHKVCTEEVYKIALSSNDDKRIQIFDKVTTFPYRANVFKVCEGEMLSKNKLIELDEDIDICETEDIYICKTEDIDICKTEDTDICKTKDKDKDKDKTTNKIKTEDKDILDKINNKIDTINKMNKRLEKVKTEIIEKIELICESMCELQDEICSDDSWLRLVELEKIDVLIDEALNAAWNMICGENRICSEEIKIDKHKDIDGYVSKLTDVINNKIELVNKMGGVIDHVMSEIKNETNMIDEKIHKASEMDNDTLNWIDDRLNEMIDVLQRKNMLNNESQVHRNESQKLRSEEYNNTYHASIRMKPVDVKDNTYIDFRKEINNRDPQFKFGDHVRISKCKNIFTKGYMPNWSEEMFIIRKIKNTVPWTYVINDLSGEEIIGIFYENELQDTKQNEFRIEKVIKKKGDKSYVKWKGYDNSFNSWIDKKDIV